MALRIVEGPDITTIFVTHVQEAIFRRPGICYDTRPGRIAAQIEIDLPTPEILI